MHRRLDNGGNRLAKPNDCFFGHLRLRGVTERKSCIGAVVERQVVLTTLLIAEPAPCERDSLVLFAQDGYQNLEHGSGVPSRAAPRRSRRKRFLDR
jgi:hypothetical protein